MITKFSSHYKRPSFVFVALGVLFTIMFLVGMGLSMASAGVLFGDLLYAPFGIALILFAGTILMGVSIVAHFALAYHHGLID